MVGFKLRMANSLQQIKKWLRRLRRVIAKSIEPHELEPDPKWDIPINIGLKTAAALRKCLKIDEQSYLFISGQAWHDTRDYVLYTALDEVKKTSTYLMRLRELYQETIPPPTDRISRLVLTQVNEEQESRIRRLLEVLLTLILFENTNEQPYYRHLLHLEELENLLSANADFDEFYGARSGNIDESINREIHQIQEIENNLDLSRCWYLVLKESLNLKKLRPGGIMSSVRTRIKFALPHMSDSEKVAFNFSYAGYIDASESIHYSINRHDYQYRERQPITGVSGLGLITMLILNRCHQLMGRPDVPLANKLYSLLKDKTNVTSLVYSMTVRDIEVNDFCLAYGDLGEVVEIKESDYGYRSYRVRYLAEKPTPDIQEDWFPARYVQKFYTRAQFFKKIQSEVAEGKLPQDIGEKMGKLSSKELQPLIRASLIETWKHGLRDWVHSQGKKVNSGDSEDNL